MQSSKERRYTIPGTQDSPPLSLTLPPQLKPDYPSESFCLIEKNKGSLAFSLDQNLKTKLSTLGEVNKTDLRMVILTSLHILLYHYSYQIDSSIKVVSDEFMDLDSRITLNPETSFISLLEQIDKNMNHLSLHPPEEKVHETLSEHSANVIYSNTEEFLNNQINCFAIILDKENAFKILFNTSIYKERTITQLKNNFIALLNSIVQQPALNIANLSLLSQQDLDLLDTCNKTETVPTITCFAHEVLTKNALEVPEKKAQVFYRNENDAPEVMTYHQLDHATNQLGAYLMQLGILSNKAVAIHVERENCLTALYGVYKSGGYALPLNLSDKPATSLYKIEECQASVIVVDKQSKALLPPNLPSSIKIVDLDVLSLQTMNLAYSKPVLATQDLAYIRYTSGSTGTPKGVMISHAALINQLNSLLDRELKKFVKVLVTAPLSFDASDFEFGEALVNQGEAHIIFEKGRVSPETLTKILKDNHIEAVTLLPAILNNLNPDEFKDLQDVITMGEPPTKHLIKTWAQKIRIRNECGRTETGICDSMHISKLDEPFSCIGKPIRNMKVFIVNPNAKKYQYECPISASGEMWLSGLGLAKGYLNKPELTHEKFIDKLYFPKEHYFTDIPTDTATESKFENAIKIRLYRTGDLGYRMFDGSLDLIGRVDDQLKVGGVRIEPSSVESSLLKHSNIKNVAVLATPDKQSLITFIVLKDPTQLLQRNDVNMFLQTQTTEATVVHIKFVECVDKLPITDNGKIDKKALLAKYNQLFITNSTVTQPTTLLQKQLKELLISALQSKQDIGIDEKFIEELGMTSMQLGTFEKELNIAFFNHPIAKEAKISVNLKDFSTHNTIQKIEQLLIHHLESMIQHVLNHYPNILQSVSVIKTDKSIIKAFVFVILKNPDNTIKIADLNNHLLKKLPFISMFKQINRIYCFKEFPFRSGQIDKQALINIIEFKKPQESKAYSESWLLQVFHGLFKKKPNVNHKVANHRVHPMPDSLTALSVETLPNLEKKPQITYISLT